MNHSFKYIQSTNNNRPVICIQIKRYELHVVVSHPNFTFEPGALHLASTLLLLLVTIPYSSLLMLVFLKAQY